MCKELEDVSRGGIFSDCGTAGSERIAGLNLREMTTVLSDEWQWDKS